MMFDGLLTKVKTQILLRDIKSKLLHINRLKCPRHQSQGMI